MRVDKGLIHLRNSFFNIAVDERAVMALRLFFLLGRVVVDAIVVVVVVDGDVFVFPRIRSHNGKKQDDKGNENVQEPSETIVVENL